MNIISPRTTTPIRTHYIILDGIVGYTKQLNYTIWNTFCTTKYKKHHLINIYRVFQIVLRGVGNPLQ